jgi:Tfp pilus assembly protein PilV
VRSRSTKSPQLGTTFSEVLIAILLLAFFFVSIFELNAICLRYIDASKESVAAMQLVHDRSEVLRNLAFRDLTTASYLQNLLGSPANGSDFARNITEVVKVSQYPTASGTTQLTRNPNGTVTTDSIAADLGTGLVQVDVSAAWNMTFGGRARSTQITSIVSNGTKK